jgi:hypothetical protein
LGTYSEKDSVYLTIAATANRGTAISHYFITDGAVPFGMSLNRATGELSGTLDDLVDSTLPAIEVSGKPVWNDSGALATIEEGQTYSCSLSVIPSTGRTINRFAVVNGNIPLGLKLDLSTGEISGVPAMFNRSAEPRLASAAIPVWTTTGSLGDFAVSASVTIPLLVTTETGTISGYSIISGEVPFGLSINPTTGVLSGIVDTQAALKTYTFIVRVYNSAGGYADQTLTITVA